MSDIITLFPNRGIPASLDVVHVQDFNKLVEAYNNMLHACKLLEKRVIELEQRKWWWW